jgi:hypothetical protein
VVIHVVAHCANDLLRTRNDRQERHVGQLCIGSQTICQRIAAREVRAGDEIGKRGIARTSSQLSDTIGNHDAPGFTAGERIRHQFHGFPSSDKEW